MEEDTQSAETETSCDISIAIEDDCTSMERRTMSPRAERPPPPPPPSPPPPPPGVAKDYHLAETETSCDVPAAIRKLRTRKKKTLFSTMLKQKRLKRKIDSDLSDTVRYKILEKDYPERSSHISIDIQNDPSSMEHRTIRRLPPQLVEVNKEAYEPYVISFGPYHHPYYRNEHLSEMEGRKVQSLNRLLEWTNESSDKIRLPAAIRNMVEEAQNCYSDGSYMAKETFAKMMVLDGCFIIQLIMGTLKDPFCTRGLIYTSILRDLVLIENQLPFFALCKLLDTIPKKFFDLDDSTDPKSWFISRLLKRFEDTMPGLRVDKTYDEDSMKNVKHIVHLLHSNWLPSDKAMAEYKKHSNDGKWRFIRSATELREAGIEFKMAETEGNENQSLFDIKFEKGILKMPKLTIEDDTESLYRNLIACEQFDNELPVYLFDYVALMDCLINSGKDVELLCQCKIIDNLLGDDESVAVLFNRLGDHAMFSRKTFFYAQLFNDINKHYDKTWNKWKANLMLKYFNTPWAFISFLAATLLILLTVLQTTFTIFPRS